MVSKGLSKEKIVNEAIKIIEKNGKPDICLHEISRQLGIKTPSLYNHIKNTDELENSIFKYAIDLLVNQLELAIKNKEKDEAIKAFANQYIEFAIQNKGLYLLIMSIPKSKNSEAKQIALPLLNLVIDILKPYNLNKEYMVRYQRILRALLHGFIAEIYLDYFYYYSEINIKDSITLALENFAKEINLHSSIKENSHATK